MSFESDVLNALRHLIGIHDVPDGDQTISYRPGAQRLTASDRNSTPEVFRQERSNPAGAQRLTASDRNSQLNGELVQGSASHPVLNALRHLIGIHSHGVSPQEQVELPPGAQRLTASDRNSPPG